MDDAFPIGAGLLFLALAGLLILAAPLFVRVPPPSAHAIAEHGRAATRSYEHISQHDPDKDPFKRLFDRICPDGRRYLLLRLPKLAGKPVTWAVYITTGDGRFNVTSYLSSNKSWVDGKINWCSK